MSSLSRELVFLILQFLDEEKFKETVHKLEQESGFFFNMKYFEEKVLAGEWEEVEKYLSGITKVDDNRYSMKIFFEIRKQKYLEALDRQDKAKAVEILLKDLKVFSTFNEDLYKEITQLLTLGNFRENEQLSKYGDTKTARSIMLIELKKLLEANPLFREKLVFPNLKSSRLRTLINQSLNWQHQLCKNPRPNPDIKSLFTDHTCIPPNGVLPSTPVNLPAAAVAKPTTFTSLGAHGPFPPTAAAANANAFGGWTANAAASSSVQAAVVAAPSLPVPSNQVAILKRPITPPATLGMVDYQNTDHEQLMKRLRPSQSVEEVTYSTARQQPSWSLDDLPRTVAFTMHQGSAVASMDFHPSHRTLLLVGSVNGEITLYEVGMREQLVSKSFKIWDIAACSLSFQASHVKDAPISVSRVAWSPDGHFMGAAFTKHLIHLYAYPGSNDLRQLLEVDAHVGGVNDLAFAHLNKQLCVVTCGDDKLIKVWDLAGRKLYSFEGHEAPVFSICPHQKESIQFIFSTAIDGKIKAWLYDNVGSRVDYDAPGRWCTTMLYSADRSRLFSCGTSKEGDTFLVEWNESEGTIKRTYTGFRKKSAGVVQFDTTQNRILAVGEDNQIKFWDMDNINILTSTDAEGGLPSLPRLRFNKEGNLLAVSTAENGFKILATAAGLRSLRVGEPSSFEALKSSVEPAAIKVSGSSAVANVTPVNCKVERSSPVRPSAVLNGVNPMSKSMEKPRTLADVTDKTKPWQLAEIVDPVQCRLVTMPDSTDTGNKVARLLYTNSGVGILALGSNGIQKLWKWVHNEQNPSGKATANVVPLHWQPNSGLLMTNDTSGVNLEEAVPCIALSKNDSYVMSASGGKVSLFNMMTFKVMTTFMPPPPASTFLAFHPQDNNVIAVGMEDSTIHIYNVRVDEVKSKLKSHQKHVTGLAFSTNLNILVSSGADAQLCVWSIDSWEKRKSVPLQMPTGMAPAGDTRVQFHSNQIRLLVSHETQLAIYDASKMDRICQWIPHDALSAPISYAAYSCNSQLVYTSFCDGNIGVFNADSLRLRCRIAPSAYLSQAVLNGSQAVYPLVVAAHPQEPHQFAVGLTNGSVKVIEPSESEGKWGESPPVDNGMLNGRTGSSLTTSNHASDQLGDSISDTGNLIRETPIGAASPFARLPYGETFFNNATGRCSNGLLMIDYFALAAGLPFLNPYKNSDANFEHGANFAVAGSTALSTQVLANKNILSPVTNSSLHVQLHWMRTHFHSICHNNRDCVEKLKNSLFMVGEIGGNDYNYALFQGKSIEEVKSMVHDVVGAIKNTVRKVIHYGAVRMIVPGNFPIDSLPAFLAHVYIPGLDIVVDPCAAILVLLVTGLVCGNQGAGRYLGFKTGWAGYEHPIGYFPFGIDGMLAGSATVFFAYTGFYLVASTAEEGKNPQQDLPLGIGAALSIYCMLYMLVFVVIVGLVPYYAMDPDTPISSAFASHGMPWAVPSSLQLEKASMDRK
ncbi:hypothetical protein F0562_029269 [Nyssa sinensis]|uniref:CTLH domain-containing protein n=1 Tax=Nyssa sinensis TaxID=561372 RepID=A0A5J5B6J1_9ASTE|nr:hypothetical protein F0562_029269 [Nyssa sinensis]